MIDTDALFGNLSIEPEVQFGERPTESAIRTEVRRLKAEGLCGRRIAEQRLGPYFLASPEHGRRELDLLDEILTEEFENSDRCVWTHQSECSRLKGGCRGSR